MQLILSAKHDFFNLAHEFDVDVLSFHGFGSDLIKIYGFSPDGFMQTVLQVAAFRLFGEIVPSEEVVQIRQFVHGRVELTRGLSLESAKFCELMGLHPKRDEANSFARQAKLDVFKQAVERQVQQLHVVRNGMGVDRHFFGIHLMIRENEERPDLLLDPVFLRSSQIRMCTANMTHSGIDIWGTTDGFDPTGEQPDGISVVYFVNPRHCTFTVSARNPFSWPSKLCHHIEEVLIEMRTLLESEHAKGT